MQVLRTGPSGQYLCQREGCDAVATAQTLRHATDAEYEAIPETFRPIDGLARIAVHACTQDAAATDAFYAHDPDAGETCTHAHRPDCSVFEGCQCATSDPPPARPPRQ